MPESKSNLPASPPGLEHLANLPKGPLPSNDIWSVPTLTVKPPVFNKQITISLEAPPSPQVDRIIQILDSLGYQVYNQSNPSWVSLYRINPTGHLYPYLVNQMLHHSIQLPPNSLGFQVHRNLYGLLPICLEWFQRNGHLTEQQTASLRACAGHLLKPPDYIIYLYLPVGKLTDNQPYNRQQLESLYAEYEWILDNTHCPYPVFKVNLLDPPERVVDTILTIFHQIVERVELEVDT